MTETMHARNMPTANGSKPLRTAPAPATRKTTERMIHATKHGEQT